MRDIISGNAEVQPEAVSGTDDAVCYLDLQRGTSSNAVWRAWFASDATTMLAGGAPSIITFFAPCVQFPSTTHYTVVAADGQVHEYAISAQAIQSFQTLPPQEVSSKSQVQTVFPRFWHFLFNALFNTAGVVYHKTIRDAERRNVIPDKKFRAASVIHGGVMVAKEMHAYAPNVETEVREIYEQ